MAWYDEAIFYHIYPLGMTGAPKHNDYGEPVERLNRILPWISHIKKIGCNAIYIGPLFESVGHGYETTDYKKLDSRLGTNATLKNFVAECHKQEVKVIFDGVFNHTGRDFFAFKDIKENRENSRYKDWYCNVNFWGNNSYNDGFGYENWGGHDLLVKLNQKNPEVINYICEVIRFWVDEFDVDGIRLDAADVLDFDFMKALRRTAIEVKNDFWLMGEVIHGDYIRWANDDTLHSVTNYHLHKALYSGYNDHNFFEIAHTVKRLNDMCGGVFKLYNFVDNHDVERIMSKLSTAKGFMPVHILLYTLPGVPSIYYGSEFGIEGKKGRGAEADDALRPEMVYEEWEGAEKDNVYTKLIAALGQIRQQVKALSYGDYKELNLTNRQYAFSRSYEGSSVVVMVNNDDSPCNIYAGVQDGVYTGALSGKKVVASGGGFTAEIAGNSGEIWVPEAKTEPETEPEKAQLPSYAVESTTEEDKTEESTTEESTTEESKTEESKTGETATGENITGETATEEMVPDLNKPYEDMSIEELQASILAKMEKNGPVTEDMRRTVEVNTHQGSLLNWVRSFR